MRDCEREGVDNIRVADCDAVTLLTKAVPSDWLAGLRIYFPDPWPKVRQQKRRLVQAPFAHLAASRMAPGAVMHLATDWVPYADHMLDVLSHEPLLRNQHEAFAPRPQWRPITKFEQRGIDLGHEIRDLMFERVESV
jgi:tRNA (guanine-N7-)-methyltransferase